MPGLERKALHSILTSPDNQAQARQAAATLSLSDGSGSEEASSLLSQSRLHSQQGGARLASMQAASKRSYCLHLGQTGKVSVGVLENHVDRALLFVVV